MDFFEKEDEHQSFYMDYKDDKLFISMEEDVNDEDSLVQTHFFLTELDVIKLEQFVRYIKGVMV